MSIVTVGSPSLEPEPRNEGRSGVESAFSDELATFALLVADTVGEWAEVCE